MKRCLYVAYGSNLNLNQMLYRCPESQLIATGMLNNHELLFKGNNGNCYCTIQHTIGGHVPVGVFKISERDLKALDRYEGYPIHYRRVRIKPSELCLFNGETKLRGLFAYVMNDEIGSIGMPSQHYFNVVLQGYRDCGFDERYLYYALDKSMGLL